MTSIQKLAAAIVATVLLMSVSAYAQSATAELNHYEADRISFDYPAGFLLKDESTSEAQQLTITRGGSSVRLTITSIRTFVLQAHLPAAIQQFKEPAIKNVTLTLGQTTEPKSFQTQVGGKQAEGVRLQSTGKKIMTGEVIWLRLRFRLLGFVYSRSAADEKVGSELWKTVSSSFRVEAPVVAATAGELNDNTKSEGGVIEGGVMNGKALALPHPAYPPIARVAHASGSVKVQVLIDEQGNVIAAHAVDGHPLLQAVSVAAAREAKFSPTLLEGEPVKVTGVIVYNFVAQ